VERDFQRKAHEMCTFFEKRGYSRTPLEDHLQRVSRVSRRDAIQNAKVVTNGTDRIPLVFIVDVPSFQQSHQKDPSDELQHSDERRNHQGDFPSFLP